MTVFSIHDRITGWVDDQLAKEDPLGADEWGRHLTMSVTQTPKGDSIGWVLLVTLRSPWLGQDAIGSRAKFRSNFPQEAVVRVGVTGCVADLRREFEARKAAGFPKGNGHNQAGLPPGLRKAGLG